MNSPKNASYYKTELLLELARKKTQGLSILKCRLFKSLVGKMLLGLLYKPIKDLKWEVGPNWRWYSFKNGGLKVQVSSQLCKAIQNSAYGVLLDCFYMLEVGLDFSIHHFLSHWITTLIGAGIRVVGQPNILVTLTSTL